MATAASKSKQKTPKSKDSPKPSAPASGTATPDVAEAAKPAVSGRPDKAVYDAEQAQIKSEIDALQAKIVRPNCSCACSQACANWLVRTLSRRRFLWLQGTVPVQNVGRLSGPNLMEFVVNRRISRALGANNWIRSKLSRRTSPRRSVQLA